MRRRWKGISLAVVLMASLVPPAWANQELHPGARLFYPLWDTSTPNRLTFIVISREPIRAGAAISPVVTGTILSGSPTTKTRFKVEGTPGNCIPRGAAGSSKDINRTDLGGTASAPVFVDDIHLEYYGKSCISADEVVHMSCADIDLFLLAAPNNSAGLKPRFAFSAVANDGMGALDAHLIINGARLPEQRKNTGRWVDKACASYDCQSKMDNSLMGHAIISDIAEGWAATYPAAAAKTTTSGFAGAADGGTLVGYENYPMEVFLPFALADPFAAVPSGAAGHPLRNVLSLWGPSFQPGKSLNNTTISVQFTWFDGRERAFPGSVVGHTILAPLGGDPIQGLDPPLDGAGFTTGNFVCGHAPSSGQAENDGFPRAGSSATACGAPGAPDTTDPSDNFEATGDTTITGAKIQSSTPIGWWTFTLQRDGLVPNGVFQAVTRNGDTTIASKLDHSGRGLVGVVLSSTPGAVGNGVGDATRLWHKTGCDQSWTGQAFGPTHFGVSRPSLTEQKSAIFNIMAFSTEHFLCYSGL